MVEINRTVLRVWEWGDPDAPAILCAHGAYDHGRMWDGLAPRLAALGFRVVAVDLRGHGDSGRLSSGAVWAASALDLGLMARRLGPPVGAIGHSFGAGQIMYAAGVWPESFAWVVNLDGLGPPGEDGGGEFDIAAGATRSVESVERLRSRPARTYASLDDMVARRQGVNVRLPAAWTRHLVEHAAMPHPDGGFTWKFDPMFQVGFPGDFDGEYLEAEHAMVECPVLVLTGGEDDTWSELSLAAIEARLVHLADHRHRVIEGAGHYVHVEQPDTVVAAIEEFLDEIGARP